MSSTVLPAPPPSAFSLPCPFRTPFLARTTTGMPGLLLSMKQYRNLMARLDVDGDGVEVHEAIHALYPENEDAAKQVEADLRAMGAAGAAGDHAAAPVRAPSPAVMGTGGSAGTGRETKRAVRHPVKRPVTKGRVKRAALPNGVSTKV